MSWNYRIMKRKNELGELKFGIYEVYYDDNGNIKGYTKKSLISTCTSEKDLKVELEIMMKAFEKQTLIYQE